jgi:multidrug efflux pump
MGRTNLSALALAHGNFMRFLVALVFLGGAFAFVSLGRREDPDFTFRVMVVKVFWPGATAGEVDEEITHRLETKLQDLPQLDYIESYSKPGEATLFVRPLQSTTPAQVVETWYQVRKRAGDIRHLLPEDAIGPFYDDEFGDTFTTIYAFGGEGVEHAELREIVKSAREQLLRIKGVEKAQLLGLQDEKIYVEFDQRRLSELGLSTAAVADQLGQQNAIVPGGIVEAGADRVPLRLTGGFHAIEDIDSAPIRAGANTVRLSDIATVRHGYEDPPVRRMRFNGTPVIGLGLVLGKNADVLAVGREIDAAMERLRASLPVGVDVAQVANQPHVVREAVGEFTESFLEALVIVLGVSFLSLGLRAGTVVALTVPLVLGAVFVVMLVAGMELHRISLGALILALGLLVDDAMIATEMMARKMEEGWERLKAAGFAYETTAFPMLTGTSITVAGFLPIGLARSNAGEYTGSIFWVTAIALSLSWLAAVLFAPFLGAMILKSHVASQREHFQTRFYRRLRAAIGWCVGRRWTVIAATAGLFALGVLAMLLVPKQFFPLSNRPEILVDILLPEGATLVETDAAAKRVEAEILKDPEVRQVTSYVGEGTPRFFLLLVEKLSASNFAELVVLSASNRARERVMQRIEALLAADFPEVRGRTLRLQVGPPVDYPVAFRIVSENPGVVRRYADEVARLMRGDGDIVDVTDDWTQAIRTLRLELDQDKARALGVSSRSVALALAAEESGIKVGALRERDQLIDIVWRARAEDRGELGNLRDVNVATATGAAVPLDQLVRLVPHFEEGVIWRRNGLYAVTVRADVRRGVEPPAPTWRLWPKLQAVADAMPFGTHLELGGSEEENVIAQRSIFAWLPLAGAVTLFLLMVQLQNLSRALMVVATAPLGVIGAAFALLAFQAPFGFVALLGLIALAGMIMRNAVILVDQIEQDVRAGSDDWTAVVEATVRRFRPIMLTAAAAVLAMIPLSRSDFFGPQAITIMGGLVGATALTIFFVPALYAAWFRVGRPARTSDPARPLGPMRGLASAE